MIVVEGLYRHIDLSKGTWLQSCMGRKPAVDVFRSKPGLY
jgi:hypothetical protein